MSFDSTLPFSGRPTDSLGRADSHLHWLSFAAVSRLLTPRVGFILSLVIILVAKYTTSPWRKVPPGPKGLPILGNILQLKDKRWMFEKDCKRNFRMSNSKFRRLLRHHKLTREISENIMYLYALGQPMIVINSLKAASELLDQRANIYSDRPRQIVAHEILCGGLVSVFMAYGDLLVFTLSSEVSGLNFLIPSWRRMRRAQHEALTKVAVLDYHSTFSKEATVLASSILNNPTALNQYFKRSSTSAIMSILYDYPTLEDEHDQTVTEINVFLDRMSASAAPGAHLVELLPWMIYIPERYAHMPYIMYLKCLLKENPRFARWKREGLEHFRQHTAMFNRCLNAVCDDIVS